MAVDPVVERLLAGFIREAEEICQRVTLDLLALERQTEEHSNRERLHDSVARQLHTLKGSAATLGMDDVAALAHRMEDVVKPLRDALSSVPSPVADTILKVLDVALGRIRAHAGGQGADLPWVAEALQWLDAARAVAVQTAASNPGASAFSRDDAEGSGLRREEPSGVKASGDSRASWRVDGQQVSVMLADLDRLRELRLQLNERRRLLEKMESELAKPQGSSVTELRTVLRQCIRGLSTDSEDAGSVVSSLEEELKAICTLPARTILDPLYRTVRDLSRQLQKEARLSVVGADLALDRRLLEALRGPLLHLVRNAIDHGLEDPNARQRASKHREGAIVIRFEQLGNMLFVEVSDDGAGLDMERIREQARARRSMPEQELAALNENDLQQLIFKPGFSTKKEVTSVSGRGIGLDIVLSELRKLDGQIEVRSVALQGTRFSLSIPAKLGSSAVLVLRAAELTLGVPLASVEAIRASRLGSTQSGSGNRHFEHQGELVPVRELAELLGLRQPSSIAEAQPMIVLLAQGRRLALAVDDVLNHHELLIRPLPRELRDLPAYQGVATLAGGELLLILRPSWIGEGIERANASAPEQRRALVVDDSLTARAMHRAILEAGGFKVYTASSGRQALGHLKHMQYEVIVADVDMPDIDGLALARAVRADSQARSTPMILVSALDGRSGWAQGLAAGADAYLSKKDCAAGRLLSEVSAVIAKRRGAA